MTTRLRTHGDPSVDDGPFRRFWRGPAHETSTVRSLLDGAGLRSTPAGARAERDGALLAALRVLEVMRDALHAGAALRELARRSQ
jgi:hypothetical protein